MSDLSFQYPLWMVFACLLLAAFYAVTLYFRDKTFKEQSKWLNRILAVLRFLAVAGIALLLLAPVLKSSVSESKKPLIVLAQDNSESVGNSFSPEEKTAYIDKFVALQKKLEERYEVISYQFGSEIKESETFDFSDKTTNISNFLESVYDLYSNQNLGGIVMATDGIFNEGSNPIYASTKLNVPIYTIGLGDTTVQKDLIVKKVYHNRIAYLGDKFTVEVDIAAQNCINTATTLTISKISGKQTKKLFTKRIAINKNDFFTTEDVILEADKSGVQRYRVSLSGVDNEITLVNNRNDIFIDVLDARQKILLLANAPHPDISALKQVISLNKNYELEVGYVDSFKGAVAGYDFVILHQVPGKAGEGQAILKTLSDKNIPRLFILGEQSQLAAFNKHQSLINVKGRADQNNEVAGNVRAGFNLFTIDEAVKRELPKFPPLYAPFGEYKATKADVLLDQKIGSVETKYPLLLFGEEQNTKIAVLCGTGIWKWRVFDYLQHQNTLIFDEIIGKTLQYVSLKEDKRRFRAYASKNIYNENEAIQLDAELYNETYELINEPDAFLVIKDENGKDFPFTFNKTSNAYELSAGYFPTGNYNFQARTNHVGKELKVSGRFSVQPIEVELFETAANHQLLRQLSNKFGGKLLTPDTLLEIADDLDAKPVIYTSQKTRAVINLKWLFFLLMTLLGVEWFTRKYFGGY